MIQNELSSNNGAFELKRHFSRWKVTVSCAYVVEQAAEIVRLIVVLPLREVRTNQRCSYSNQHHIKEYIPWQDTHIP